MGDGKPATSETLGVCFGILDDEERFFALTNRLKAMLRDGQLEKRTVFILALPLYHKA